MIGINELHVVNLKRFFYSFKKNEIVIYEIFYQNLTSNLFRKKVISFR